jgi:acyl-CoA reductase-like NAD-dependent aldehyde dehydrogenase
VELPAADGHLEARPALAAGNCVVLKPAEQTPARSSWCSELIGDLLPAGVLNIVNGFGVEAGKPLASAARASPRSPSPARPRPAG